MIKHILISVFLFGFLNLSAQGRIDTLDIENYQIRTLKLPKELNEISSLEFYDGHFWGQNDSGGKPEIYKIDSKTGEIVQKIKITNAENIDWEEIAFSDKYVFIGDIGNNSGNRKDLKILYFPISELDSNKKKIETKAEVIEFHYPEQKDFNPGKHQTNFDGEAFFFYNGKLHLFTKEWVDLETTHYTLEVKPGKQAAKKIETFKTNYLVTGAYVDDSPISNTQGLYLIGYTPDGFALISGFGLTKSKNDHLFDKKVSKFSLPLGFVSQVGQTEGIVIKPENPGVICYSNEHFKHKDFNVKQSIQCIYSLAQ